VSGLPESGIDETHARIQAAARGGRYDELFETLAASGCLVVLNHPLMFLGPWAGDHSDYGPAHPLRLGDSCFGSERDAATRGERSRSGTRPAVAQAGGGRRRQPSAGRQFCLSLSQAATFRDFIAEVKDGHAVPFVTPDYFAPLNWKLFLRVLFFMSRYRQIASYKGQPVAAMLERRRVLLDPVGAASRAFLSLVSALGLAR
jgi:hypothetical protein